MGESNQSLLDLGKLSEPASKLIEAVRSAVGLLYEPTAIRRKARAEADAQLIRVDGDIRAQELAHRASVRLVAEELRRQANIEAIVRESVRYLPTAVSSTPVDEDWIWAFFDQSGEVGNETMQSIWSRILAREVAQPGSFSRRTLATVKLLSQTDAQLFASVCRRIVRIGRKPVFLWTDATEVLLARSGLTSGAFLHLDAVGLLQDSTYFLDLRNGRSSVIEYGGTKYKLTGPKGDRLEMSATAVSWRNLTQVGVELFPLCAEDPDREFEAVLIQSVRDAGIVVEVVKE